MSYLRNLAQILAFGAVAANAHCGYYKRSIDEVSTSLDRLFAERGIEYTSAPVEKRETDSAAATYDGCLYQVAGVGGFNSKIDVSDWSASYPSSSSSDLVAITQIGWPCGVESQGTWSVNWTASNIGIDSTDGSLTLTVPGGQTGPLASSARIETSYDDILYGSVRTVAKTSDVGGAVHAAYFYYDDNQEADIEIVTGNSSYIHWTNQATGYGDASTYQSYVADSTTAYHEYRMDWVSDKTMFYIDGSLVRTISTNVPSSPAPWIWTSWFWSSDSYQFGPPAEDCVFHIKSIEMYVNRTSVTGCAA